MSTVIIVCGVTRKNRVPQKEKNYKSNVIYQRESEKKRYCDPIVCTCRCV